MSNDINYIGPVDAEWVDLADERPELNWVGLAIDLDWQYHLRSGASYRTGERWLRLGGPSTAILRVKNEHPDGMDALKTNHFNPFTFLDLDAEAVGDRLAREMTRDEATLAIQRAETWLRDVREWEAARRYRHERKEENHE